VEREVMVRTRDDLAVLQDLPKGQNQVAHGFPVTPTFDALSYFTLQWFANAHMALSAYVKNVQPLTYTEPSPTEKPDVIVVNLRYYRAAYAPDSSDAPDGHTHIMLQPYQFVTRNAGKSAFYFSDVTIDNASGLPSRVHFIGPDDRDFSVDYSTIENHWLVTHAHYEETLFGPLHIGAVHVIADAAYDRFSFPNIAPDPRL
jgi:hypothetical protein